VSDGAAVKRGPGPVACRSTGPPPSPAPRGVARSRPDAAGRSRQRPPPRSPLASPRPGPARSERGSRAGVRAAPLAPQLLEGCADAALAADHADVADVAEAIAAGEGGAEGIVVVAMAAGDQHEVRAGSERQLRERVREIDAQHATGGRETARVREVGPVVEHGDPHPEEPAHLGEGDGDVTAADDHQLVGRAVRLEKDLLLAAGEPEGFPLGVSLEEGARCFDHGCVGGCVAKRAAHVIAPDQHPAPGRRTRTALPDADRYRGHHRRPTLQGANGGIRGCGSVDWSEGGSSGCGLIPSTCAAT
jgi:hypothetical protein